MVKHLFSNFLEDEMVYKEAERFWIDLWEQIDPETRARHGWQQPWFGPLPPTISEGNPIFSAVSLRERRGIRIIQAAPMENGLEFVAYPDTFGGSIFDPEAINELVISCALSEEAARLASSKMIAWVEGRAISFEVYEAGFIATNGLTDERIYTNWDLVREVGMISSSDIMDEGDYAGRHAA
jgi:hypothetical protein